MKWLAAYLLVIYAANAILLSAFLAVGSYPVHQRPLQRSEDIARLVNLLLVVALAAWLLFA